LKEAEASLVTKSEYIRRRPLWPRKFGSQQALGDSWSPYRLALRQRKTPPVFPPAAFVIYRLVGV